MIGWRLENVVYIELLRRCAYDFLDVYYHKSAPRAKEIDFVVCDKNRAVELIQVAYEIDIHERITAKPHHSLRHPMHSPATI